MGQIVKNGTMEIYESYKERRTLEVGEKVKVYFDLHRHTFSIQLKGTNHVYAKGDFVKLVDCTFEVSETRRQKVIATKTKNVHAKVVGHIQPLYHEDNLFEYRIASYNPFKAAHFFDKETGEKITHVSEMILFNGRMYYK